MLERFLTLFSGNPNAYVSGILKGREGERKQNNNYSAGKIEMKYLTISEEPTVTVLQEHLEGTCGMGIIPIRDDNTVVFGSLDIDRSGLDFQKVEIEAKEYGGLCFESKSGGLHIHFFVDTPIQATKMRKFLGFVAGSLGFAGAEIFPKQSAAAKSYAGAGNGIFLPYFGGKPSCIYGSKRLKLNEFVEYAEKSKISKSFIDETIKRGVVLNNKIEAAVVQGAGEGLLDGAPPCIVFMFNNMEKMHSRQEVLMQAAVFLKKKYPEEWENKLVLLNKSLKNPQDESGVSSIKSSLNKEDYSYSCRSSWMSSFCVAEICATGKYGPKSKQLDVSNLVVINSDPPVWELTVEDKKVLLSAEQIINYKKVREAVLMQTKSVLLPSMKQQEWDELFARLNSKVKTEQPDYSDTEEGQLHSSLSAYIFHCIKTSYTEQQARERKLPFIKKVDGKPIMEYTADHLNSYVLNHKKEYYGGAVGARRKINQIMRVEKVRVNAGEKRIQRCVSSADLVRDLYKEFYEMMAKNDGLGNGG